MKKLLTLIAFLLLGGIANAQVIKYTPNSYFTAPADIAAIAPNYNMISYAEEISASNKLNSLLENTVRFLEDRFVKNQYCKDRPKSFAEIDKTYFLDPLAFSDDKTGHPLCDTLEGSPVAGTDLAYFFSYYLELDERCMTNEADRKKLAKLIYSKTTLLEFAVSNLTSLRYEAKVGEKVVDPDYFNYDGSEIVAYVSYDPKIIRSRFAQWITGDDKNDFKNIICESEKDTLGEDTLKYDPITLFSPDGIDLNLTWDLVQAHKDIKDLKLFYFLPDYEDERDYRRKSYLTSAKERYDFFKNKASKRNLGLTRRTYYTGMYRCAIHILEDTYPTPIGGWSKSEVKRICYGNAATNPTCNPKIKTCVDKILSKGEM